MNILARFAKVKPLIDALRGTKALAGEYQQPCPCCAGTLTFVKQGHIVGSSSIAGSINGGCDGPFCVRWSE